MSSWRTEETKPLASKEAYLLWRILLWTTDPFCIDILYCFECRTRFLLLGAGTRPCVCQWGRPHECGAWDRSAWADARHGLAAHAGRWRRKQRSQSAWSSVCALHSCCASFGRCQSMGDVSPWVAERARRSASRPAGQRVEAVLSQWPLAMYLLRCRMVSFHFSIQTDGFDVLVKEM